MLEPFADKLFKDVIGRVELTQSITLEHTLERMAESVKNILLPYMWEKTDDITRLLIEDNWIVKWSGMNATNYIVLK